MTISLAFGFKLWHHAFIATGTDPALRGRNEMANDKVLDKLAKMIAMRDSAAEVGNKAESEAFAAAVNRMLLQHELAESDVNFAAAQENDPVVEIRVNRQAAGIKTSKVRVEWQESVARVVARANMCKFLVIPGSNAIIFVGTKSHATVAEYTYSLLVVNAAKIAHKEYCDFWWSLPKGDKEEASGFKKAWLAAFISRIAQRFEEELRRTVQEAPVSSSTAMVRINQSLVKAQQYVDGMQTRNAAGLKRTSSGNTEGRARGRAAADRMNIGVKGVQHGGEGRKALR
jgi:hypothetical protein